MVLSSHQAVLDFYRELEVESPWTRVFHLGWSGQRRELLAVTIAKPAVSSPEEARASGKPIVFIAAQAHGDEPAGKEGLMLFARDLTMGPLQPLLDQLVFVLVPQINPDGGEAGAWGIRENSAGADLNRDYVLLQSPEVRAVVTQGITRWNPHVIVDAHEALGPPRWYDFYTSYPRNEYGPSAIVRFTEKEALPALVNAMAAEGFTHFFYHTIPSGLARDPSLGITRAGGGAQTLSSYGGGAGAVTFLFETLRPTDARVGMERRARMQWTAMTALSEYIAKNATRVLETTAEAEREMISRGITPNPADSVFVRTQYRVSRHEPYRIRDGSGVVEINVAIRDSIQPLKGYPRPEAYILPPERADIATHLSLHGIEVEEVREPVRLPVECYRIDGVSLLDPAESPIERNYQLTVVEQEIEFPAGSWIVRTAQKRAGLAIHMLEPEDLESLATSGWFRGMESPGELLPVYRVPALPPGETVPR
jgi:hypothetical protein